MADEASAVHQFWSTQPVIQPGAATTHTVGPMEAVKTLDEVPKDPLPLASTLEWWTPDLSKAEDVRAIYELLRDNYVEDNDSMFRFNYSEDFLRWALTPPGHHESWHVAVRRKRDQMLMGFVSGIPITMRMGTPKKLLEKKKLTERKDQQEAKNDEDVLNDNKQDEGKDGEEQHYLEPRTICEINFLCVHKLLRAKRLAPILIKEVTRRVHLMDIWQAIYTAGKMLPTPFTTGQYFHRSLNPEKLVAIGFSGVPQRYSRFQNPIAMLKRTYQLPNETKTPGLRPMEAKDIPQVAQLLRDKLTMCDVAPVFTDEEVAHYLLPREGVLVSYVVESYGSGGSRNNNGTAKDGREDDLHHTGGGGSSNNGNNSKKKENKDNARKQKKQQKNENEKRITDFFSYFSLPSTVIGNSKYSILNAAYVYYNATTTVSITQLMNDLLIIARQKGHDVCNLVDMIDNGEYIKELKFSRGDGNLYYYFYNWSYPTIEPSGVGLFML